MLRSTFSWAKDPRDAISKRMRDDNIFIVIILMNIRKNKHPSSPYMHRSGYVFAYLMRTVIDSGLHLTILLHGRKVISSLLQIQST